MGWIYLLALGLSTGIFGVMVGTGGGIVLVPLLIIIFDIDPVLAAGTSIVLVAINSFSGTLAYLKRRLVDVRSGLIFAISAILGSVVAPFFVKSVDVKQFHVLLGTILVAVGMYMLWLGRSQMFRNTLRKRYRLAGC